ncbi:Plasmodium exported protein, unknown function [Plasmodium ovale wallikeri]|uniref:Pv-fam-d protein n=1 Tax=Plasmodium ovale wallikeri TaxID=864142 RepID=A0A1A9AR04_PLAOA|nr:Plasmodium exported protein, unknown function [Plasmodium ovale wallikeri]SBT58643.1 Plasmodium exported protein, unknown function [Plasmodium ovale wallikeri]
MREKTRNSFFHLTNIFIFTFFICAWKYCNEFDIFHKTWDGKDNLSESLNFRVNRILIGETLVYRENNYEPLKNKIANLLDGDEKTLGKRLHALMKDDEFQKQFDKLLYRDRSKSEYDGHQNYDNMADTYDPFEVSDLKKKFDNNEYGDPVKKASVSQFNNSERRLELGKRNENDFEKMHDSFKPPNVFKKTSESLEEQNDFEKMHNSFKPQNSLKKTSESLKPQSDFQKMHLSFNPANVFKKKSESFEEQNNFQKMHDSFNPANVFKKKSESFEEQNNFQKMHNSFKPANVFKKTPEAFEAQNDFEKMHDSFKPQNSFGNANNSYENEEHFVNPYASYDVEDSYENESYPSNYGDEDNKVHYKPKYIKKLKKKYKKEKKKKNNELQSDDNAKKEEKPKKKGFLEKLDKIFESEVEILSKKISKDMNNKTVQKKNKFLNMFKLINKYRILSPFLLVTLIFIGTVVFASYIGLMGTSTIVPVILGGIFYSIFFSMGSYFLRKSLKLALKKKSSNESSEENATKNHVDSPTVPKTLPN